MLNVRNSAVCMMIHRQPGMQGTLVVKAAQ
jgi:hypothetical protein